MQQQLDELEISIGMNTTRIEQLEEEQKILIKSLIDMIQKFK